MGQGWFGFNLTPAQLEERLTKLEARLAENGRSLNDIQVYVTPAPGASNADDVRAIASMGVQQIILPLFARNAAQLEERAERILSLV